MEPAIGGVLSSTMFLKVVVRSLSVCWMFHPPIQAGWLCRLGDNAWETRAHRQYVDLTAVNVLFPPSMQLRPSFYCSTSSASLSPCSTGRFVFGLSSRSRRAKPWPCFVCLHDHHQRCRLVAMCLLTGIARMLSCAQHQVWQGCGHAGRPLRRPQGRGGEAFRRGKREPQVRPRHRRRDRPVPSQGEAVGSIFEAQAAVAEESPLICSVRVYTGRFVVPTVLTPAVHSAACPAVRALSPTGYSYMVGHRYWTIYRSKHS